MNIFYNGTGIGDVLLVSLKEIPKEERLVERKGDVARLFDKRNGQTVGFNIFNISNIKSINGTGMLPLTDELLEAINKALEHNEFEETIEAPKESNFVVGYVKEKSKHPDADKLSVCQVDVGEETLQIVCGAPNIEEGQKVPVAMVGASMPTGMNIKAAKLRGVESTGMICSAKELVLPDAPREKGILVLDDRFKVGEDFLEQYHG
ncbi:YtpR family tRNA-binding protein [Bacillus sp. FJAT-44742]|uniref:YtpR family tRNA-binding protein n=1 Tax=Bacillus sp. FJAT-44742 TaxID=2014005 RepID=UPI000C238457|nr:DUF4479 family protein [Bacillus sp. FJAT-44742]